MAAGSRAKGRTSKAEQSHATRLRIVEAATRLFLRDGFVTTTMALIAREAGVAVQTLYLSFGHKTAILRAVFVEALKGEEPDWIAERDWFRGVLNEPDGAAAIRRFCEDGSGVVSRAAPVFEVMRAASADPEVAELLAQVKKLRYDDYAMIANAIADRDGFDPSLTRTDALGILYAVFSEDTFLLLVGEHGWTSERWTEWARSSVTQQFFPGSH